MAASMITTVTMARHPRGRLLCFLCFLLKATSSNRGFRRNPGVPAPHYTTATYRAYLLRRQTTARPLMPYSVEGTETHAASSSSQACLWRWCVPAANRHAL